MSAIIMLIFIILVAIVGFTYFELQDRREANRRREEATPPRPNT